MRDVEPERTVLEEAFDTPQRVTETFVRTVLGSFLFRGDAEDIGSVALVPLGSKASIGFLAIGSVDANRFHPGMSIDFLARVGDLISGALHRY